MISVAILTVLYFYNRVSGKGIYGGEHAGFSTMPKGMDIKAMYLNSEILKDGLGQYITHAIEPKSSVYPPFLVLTLLPLTNP
jgi:hypothetical protein